MKHLCNSNGKIVFLICFVLFYHPSKKKLFNNRRFPCEVRVRATPLLPCRRHGKKRNGKDIADDEPSTPTEETAPPTPAVTPAPPTPTAVKKESGKKSSKNQSKQVRQH